MGMGVQEMRGAAEFGWPRNPFPGLRPFRENEAPIFYGRNAHKDEVLARLHGSQLVFVTGPSGCGKSSLIKAGVLPALQAGLLTKAGYHWKTLQMRPGRRPLVNLAVAFESVRRGMDGDKDGVEFHGTFMSEESALWVAANSIAPLRQVPDVKAPVRLLLLIDQFEEIFGEQIQEPADVDRFVRLLVRFAERPHPNLFVIVTIRSDYLGQCANFEGLAESINRTQFLTPVLTREELGQAIARPAEDYEGTVEPRLVEQIIRDMRSGTAHQPDSLPLMQHALLWMWSRAWKARGLLEPPAPPCDEKSDGTELTLKSYQDSGGIEGILDRHAEDVLTEAVAGSQERRQIAENLFRRLAERDAEGRYRRSPTSAAEICRIAGCTFEELNQVIKPFEHPDVCFLEQRQSDSADEILVDVSHESLIRQWNTAKAWVDAEASKVGTFRDLARAALAWGKRNRSHDFLKRRGELEVLQDWWREEKPNENWARRYAGIDGVTLADDLPRVQEYLRVSSDTDLAEQEAMERARIAQASRKQRNRYVAIAIFLLLVSVAAAGGLWWQARQAEEKARQAEESRGTRVRVTTLLAEEAWKAVGPAKAIRLMRAGIDASLPELAEIRRLGYRTLAQLRERRILDHHTAQVQSVQFAPHQPVLLTATQDGFIRFWNSETGELIDVFYGGSRFLTARWSPDGKELFIAGRDIDSFFLIPCSREKLREFFPACGSKSDDNKRSFKQDVGGGSFSPDGLRIVTGGFNTNTKLWNVVTLTEEADFGPTGTWMVGAAFSHDSQRLAVGSTTGEIRIFKIEDVLKSVTAPPDKTLKPQISMVPARELQADSPQMGPPGSRLPRVNSIAFHPSNSDILLATFQDGVTRLWRSIAEDKQTLLPVDRVMAFQGTFNNDGDWAVTTHDDRIVRLWPLRASQPTAQILQGHEAVAFTVAYSPDGMTIASGSSDRTARLWSQQPALGRISVSLPDLSGTFSPPLTQKDSNIILRIKDKEFVLKAPIGFGEIAAVSISPSGKDVVIAPKQGRPYLFNLGSSEHLAALPGRPAKWSRIGFFGSQACAKDHAPTCVIGVTEDGHAYSWPYFSTLLDLKKYAEARLPSGLQVREDVECRIKAKPESECPPPPDTSSQE
jgi:WD40 repeat protein/energy-coupling factor transporter ATP-binding protein EcfA2